MQYDNKKSLCAFLAGDNFLATTWLCLDTSTKSRSKDREKLFTVVTGYLTDLENYTQLSRYYITPELYIEYGKLKDADKYVTNSNITQKDLENDMILMAYQFFKLHVDTLISGKEPDSIPLGKCELCDRL